MHPINPTRKPTPPTPHTNPMGGPSYTLSPLSALRVAAASAFFGEEMYYDAKPRTAAHHALLQRTLGGTISAPTITPATYMADLIDAALDADPTATLLLASTLRLGGHMRATPQVILARAAMHPRVRGTGLIRRLGTGIIQRLDDATTQLAYLKAAFPGKPIPNSLKRLWRDKLSAARPYALAKYGQPNRTTKLVDVINVSHPRSEAVDAYMRGEIRNTDTWEAIVSARGSTPDAWAEAMGQMGHMALLRNIRNLLSHGVPADRIRDQLVQGVATGKQLPFRYLSARDANPGAPAVILDALDECLEIATENLPFIPGRVMSLCDNSGSATSARLSSMSSRNAAEVANLSAVMTARQSEEGWVGVFGDRLHTFEVRKRASTLDQVRRAGDLGKTVGASTENGVWLFWKQAIQAREHWDTVVIYSDMQAGHGGLYGTDPAEYGAYRWNGSRYIDVPALIAAYRREVNPNVLVFLVQVAGYNDTLIPETYHRTFVLGGWSTETIRYVSEVSRQYR